jgi:general secretion pathway protein L
VDEGKRVKTLRVRLCLLAELGADSTLDFEILDAKRTVLQRGTAVPGALPRLPRSELVIAAPDVLLIEAPLPPLSGARLRAALPAIAEPHMLSQLEAAYVVATRPVSGQPATLAVLDRALLQRALMLLRRLNLEPGSATPEQLSLPRTDAAWRLRMGSAYGCLRTSRLRGIACSAPQEGAPPVELRIALEQADARPQAIEVEGACDAEAWSRALGVPVIAVAAAEASAPAVAFELLQYELSPRMMAGRSWRMPAAIALLSVLTWIVGLNLDAWLMLREERVLRARIDAALREALPDVPVVLDPLKQMRRRLSDLRTGAGVGDAREFLPLAAALARALPAEADAVRMLEFRDQVLRVDFEPRALETPRKREALLEQVSAAGLAGSFSETLLTVRRKGDGS